MVYMGWFWPNDNQNFHNMLKYSFFFRHTSSTWQFLVFRVSTCGIWLLLYHFHVKSFVAFSFSYSLVLTLQWCHLGGHIICIGSFQPIVPIFFNSEWLWHRFFFVFKVLRHGIWLLFYHSSMKRYVVLPFS